MKIDWKIYKRRFVRPITVGSVDSVASAPLVEIPRDGHAMSDLGVSRVQREKMLKDYALVIALSKYIEKHVLGLLVAAFLKKTTRCQSNQI